jgi:hypothetical protein
MRRDDIFFLVSIDECVTDIFNANNTIRELTNSHPVFVLMSNEKVNNIKNHEKYKFLFAENSFSKKMISFLHYLSAQPKLPKYIVRFDADTLMLNYKMLIKKLKHIRYNLPSYNGNFSERVSSYILEYYHAKGYEFDGPKYVRGGCSVITQQAIKTLLDNLDSIEPTDLHRDYDYFFNCLCHKLDISLKNCPLFEIENDYERKLPAWHPPKDVEQDRLNQVIRQLEILNEDQADNQGS